MAHTLRKGLFYRSFPGAVIFLDLPADRYFQLGGQSAERFARFIAGDANPDALSWLCDRGIVEARDGTLHPTQPDPQVPSTDYAQTSELCPPARLVVEAIVAFFWARRVVRRTSFQRLINNLADRQNQSNNGRDERVYPTDMLMIAAAFERAKRFIDKTDMCLPYSIAMMDVLARRGHYPNLVLGVASPFAAHCWVQQNDTVLSDRVDHVRCFAPILII